MGGDVRIQTGNIIQVHLNELECREKVFFFLASYFKK